MRYVMLALLFVVLLLPSWAWAEGVPGISGPFPIFATSGLKTADALIKTGAGFLQCIIISENDPAPTAGTIDILDATSAGQTPKLFSWTLTTSVFTPLQICPQIPFSTGLYIDFTTTNDVNVNVSYR